MDTSEQEEEHRESGIDLVERVITSYLDDLVGDDIDTRDLAENIVIRLEGEGFVR